MVHAASLSGIRPWEVFLSHRGPDVKRGFVSHLAEALRVVGVHTFVDETSQMSPQGLRTGDPAWPTILAAIKQTRLHLVVFSPGFADSEWCLEELREIMETHTHRLLPVFFNVQPGDVKLTARFDKDGRAPSWQSALQRAQHIGGWRLDQVDGCVPSASESLHAELSHIYSTAEPSQCLLLLLHLN